MASILFVSNAKGIVSRHPNPTFPATAAKTLQILEGDVTAVTLPKNADELKRRTERVLELNRLTPRFVKAGNPLKDMSIATGKITHVIYIVKENRTYDQVLGDMPQGNGDPKLVLFGNNVTPNLHAFPNASSSSTTFTPAAKSLATAGSGPQGQANAYVIQNVPYQYSKRGRIFDFEGTTTSTPPVVSPPSAPMGKNFPTIRNLSKAPKPVPDVAESPGGRIWDDVLKQNLTFRNYGFFENIGVRKGGKVIIPENYPSVSSLQPGDHDLAGVSDIDFRKFDLEYADSEAPAKYAQQLHDPKYVRPHQTYGKYEATCRFDEWNREFQMMLAKDPSGGAVPNFMTLCTGRRPHLGHNANMHTPRSMVADNDYGVGELVQAVSQSPIWKSTAILIVEDDAQNGPDHVDCHRSTGIRDQPLDQGPQRR